MAVSETAVREALATISDPAGGDIIASGRVRSVVVNGGRVGFAIAASPTERNSMEALRVAAETKIAAVEGVDRVLGALVSDESMPSGAASRERPGVVDRARSMAGRLTGRSAPTSRQPPQGARTPPQAPAPAKPNTSGAIPGVARVIAIGSGKGGVGKSTVAINLAVALAAAGQRVGLLDADIYGPSVPTLIAAQGRKPVGSKDGFDPIDAYGIRTISIGFLVDPAQAVVWRGPMVTGALSQLMRQTRWGTLDTLLIDMPPGTGDIQLSLAQQTPLAGAVIVTTPQDLALIDVRKAAGMFDQVNVPLLGVVENMATFVCPHCGETTDIFGHGGGEREAAARGVPFLGRVPLTLAIREASDAGRPVALDPSSREGSAYAQIAANLTAALERAPDRPFPKIVFE